MAAFPRPFHRDLNERFSRIQRTPLISYSVDPTTGNKLVAAGSDTYDGTLTNSDRAVAVSPDRLSSGGQSFARSGE